MWHRIISWNRMAKWMAMGVAVLLLSVGAASAQQYNRHIVQYGETLQGIAVRYGTTWQQLAAVNNIVNPNRIYAGQILLVPAVQTQPQYFRYTIVRGDTLTSIAARFGTSIDAIVAVNDITRSSRLFVGQVLNIPGRVPPAPQPQPQPIPPGRIYYVRYGDTMFRIAAMFNVNVYDLAERNRILNLNRIYAGQVLVIP
jgi:LysM repeat protein